MTADKKYWLAIDKCYEIGAEGLLKLHKYFGQMKKAWEANYSELSSAGLKRGQIESLINTRANINPDKNLESLYKQKIGAVVYPEKNFPLMLRQIGYPPAVIYIRGQIKKEDELAIAVVGTRRMSSYGYQVTKTLVRGVARAKVTILSGLAYGVDTTAHQAALEAGSRTIAVLGSGIDKASIYPQQNRGLAEKILDGRGALVSEFCPGTSPLRHHFPMRNRIIAAMSRGVLVTECPIKSGAMITAKDAADLGKDVFAVPGDINKCNCEGTNYLIKHGAKPVTEAGEILEELGIALSSERNIVGETKEEKIILKILEKGALSVNKIAKSSRIDIVSTNSTLTMMEINGKVQNIGSNLYCIKK